MCVSTSYIYKGKVKDPRYMQNKKDSRISLQDGGFWQTWLKIINLLLSRKSLRYLKKEQTVFAEIVLKKELVYEERH